MSTPLPARRRYTSRKAVPAKPSPASPSRSVREYAPSQHAALAAVRGRRVSKVWAAHLHPTRRTRWQVDLAWAGTTMSSALTVLGYDVKGGPYVACAEPTPRRPRTEAVLTPAGVALLATWDRRKP